MTNNEFAGLRFNDPLFGKKMQVVQNLTVQLSAGRFAGSRVAQEQSIENDWYCRLTWIVQLEI